MATRAVAIDLVGREFGALTVIAPGPTHIYRNRGYDNPHRSWQCRCVCGTIKNVREGNLLDGKTRSCGCMKNTWCSQVHVTHGHADSRAYHSWCGMRVRCQNPADRSYRNYGERGIAVSERWEVFDNFLKDMGEPGPGMTLERIDNDIGYGPDNCRWATRTEQARNKRNNRLLTFDGETAPLSVWAEKTSIAASTLSRRLRLGWDVDQVLRTEVRSDGN